MIYYQLLSDNISNFNKYMILILVQLVQLANPEFLKSALKKMKL